jgi:hypothetical protein
VNNRNAALNRSVAQFACNSKNVLEALFRVQAIFDPGYPTAVREPKHMPAQVRAQYEKPVVLSLERVTVRQILDEIVRRHGEMGWLAEYADPSGSPTGLKLTLLGFSGWQVAAPSRSR